MLLFLSLLGCLPAFQAKIIDTPSGRLQGWTGLSRNNRVYLADTKIPYARPPLGNLRFKNPLPYGKWQGVYTATDDSPKCLQAGGDSRIPSEVTGSEDCLYLNVYLPDAITKPLPVLIYVHGGGFEYGYPGSRDIARYLMDEDIIFVTLTYRVGTISMFQFFDYLTLSRVSQYVILAHFVRNKNHSFSLRFMSLEDDSFPGNFGCKDMAMGVKWVKKNIPSFGGNAKAITVLGISAGAVAAHMLILSPLTKGMIQGGILISGTIVDHMWTLIEPGATRNATLAAAKFLGCNSTSSEDVLKYLQKVDTRSLLNAKDLFENNPFLPVVESRQKGAFMPVSPFEIESSKPCIMSFTRGESLVERAALYNNPKMVEYRMANLDNYIDQHLRLFGLNPDNCRTRMKARYYGDVKTFDDKVTQLAILNQDARYIYGALDSIQRHKGPKWLYHMEHVGGFASDLSKKLNIVAHADDASYLFDTTSNGFILNEVDTQVSVDLIELFVNFVTHKNPTPKGSGQVWNQWTSNEMLRITTDGQIMAEPSYYRPYEDIYDFWKSLYVQK